jgi:lipoprotein-releasing system ATP-binding protein
MKLVQVEGLCKTFVSDGKKVEVLQDLSLDIEKGEVLNILGASGAGKSTLLHILGALDHPTRGKVVYGKVNIFKLGDREMARFRNKNVGFVFQFHHLLGDFNALENAMMPCLVAGMSSAEAQKRAKKVLTDMGLAKRLEHKPGELSGGEQQRVAVARAIVLSPEIVLADEPTGNLDTKTGEEVYSLLMNLNKEHGMTMVIVTHNLKLAEKKGRRVTLRDGKIVE